MIGNPEVEHDIQNVYTIGKDYVLASRNSVLETTTLLLLNLKSESTKRVVQITKPERVISHQVHRLIVPGPVSPASFYYGPSAEGIKPQSIPLIVMPHGGKQSAQEQLYTYVHYTIRSESIVFNQFRTACSISGRVSSGTGSLLAIRYDTKCTILY